MADNETDIRADRSIAYHAMPAVRVAARLEVDPIQGLSALEAERRRARFGDNSSPMTRRFG